MRSDSAALVSALRGVLRAGMTVALGDGVGQVRLLDDGTSVCEALSTVSRDVGSVRLVLGWLPAPPIGLDPDAFADVVALMPGWGVREILCSPHARFVPTSLAAWPSWLSGPRRPDLLITRLVQRNGALTFGTEVSFQRDLIDAGVPTLAIVDATAPSASAVAAMNPTRVRVVGCSHDGPVRLTAKDPEPIHDALADEVLRFVPEGARLQYGPGQLGTALLRRASRPIRIDTGVLTDAIVDLYRRGLLIGLASATYLAGSDVLYDWADGLPILHGIDHSHDVGRLSHGAPFVAVNTAIEIDEVGQVNVEGVGDKVVGGIGGHPDFSAGAHASRGGLSIVAMPSTYNGRSPLVAQLSRPASTLAHDVDLVVTESGHADLRDADWSQRRKLITKLFEV